MSDPRQDTSPLKRTPAPRLIAWILLTGVLASALWSAGRQLLGPLGSLPGGGFAMAAQPAGSPAAEKGDEPAAGRGANPFPNRIPAPSLDGGTQWLNTSGEITLKDLRGKVVLLDFWTYCCINCMHILPDLAYLEEKYPDELVVIGVHSAKFENEKDAENIRQAILRYEIKHPVINDSEMVLWRKFGARAWPTQVLIDPEGMYLGFVSGEGYRDYLDKVIARVVAYHRNKGTLDETPVRFDLERYKAEPTPLRFPGKLLVDERGGRLFISDSNHNRIVVCALDGRLIETIGTGAVGRINGGYDLATFDHPQGMALVGDTLYVADTENHLIRAVDLKEKRVSTLAGTGKQAPFRADGGRMLEIPLNSPWDLLVSRGTLYVAMAGSHQIWSHRLGTSTIQPYAGNGREDVTNGSLADSAYAQPSGLAADGDFLYVCDSEGSAVRKVPINVKGKVTTISGTSDLPNGASLFEFGDVDGIGDNARLQHPLGIAYYNHTLWIADSYNHKLKQIDLRKNETKTLFGSGEPGDGLDPVAFNEPAGLAFADGKLYVADTNNHRIVVVDLRTKQASELKIEGLEPPRLEKSDEIALADPKEVTPVPPQKVGAGDELTFQIDLKLPEGFKLNKLAPLTYRLSAPEGQDLIPSEQLDTRGKAKAEDEKVTVTVPLAGRAGKTTLELALSFGYCRDGEGGLCKIGSARWRVPVEVSPDGEQRAVRLQASAG